VRSPFVQLASIHAFIRKDGAVKQEPLCFVYMSGRKRRDYVAVLRKVVEVLPSTPAVQQIVSDFERPLWKAVQEVIVRAGHRGCAFHWGQAVWRKIADCGLQSKYSNDDATYRFCRKLLALPYIPADTINDVFEDLESGASSTQLKQVTDYVRATWIESSTWPPAAWSVYGQPIRTNNDVEGWHYRLNRKAQRSGLNMYLLFGLLHSEAAMVEIHVKLLSDKKVCRSQQHGAKRCQTKLYEYWQQYQTGTRSVQQLLNACARLYAPQQ